MSRTLELFPETKPARARPRVLMHVSDAGQVSFGAKEDLGKPMCVMSCRRCGAETDWLVFDTVTQAKRGIPCEACNTKSGTGSEVDMIKLSEPQQALVEKLKAGATLQHEAQTTGLFRLTHGGRARSVHPATVQSLLDRGLMRKDPLGRCCLTGNA